MNRFITLSALCAALASASVHAETAKAQDVIGPYLGLGLGAAFGNRDNNASKTNDDETSRAGKIFGGYQVTENFGVQAGYVRLDKLKENTGSGAAAVKQTATGRSLYLAATGRLPLGESFALTGKAGVSFGKVTAVSPSTASTNLLLGSKTSALVGVGGEYLLNRQVAFTVELERFGKLSNEVHANALTIGTRFSF